MGAWIKGLPWPMSTVIVLGAFAAVSVIWRVLKVPFGPPQQIEPHEEKALHGLKLVFDPLRHCVHDGDLIQYLVAVANNSPVFVERVSLIIESIESLTDPIHLAAQMARFKGLSLMRKDQMYRQDALPSEHFCVYQDSEVPMVVLQGQIRHLSMFLEHASYQFGPALLSSGRSAREATISRAIPPGRYRLRLLLKGSDGSTDRKIFVFSMDTQEFVFCEESPQVQAEVMRQPKVESHAPILSYAKLAGNAEVGDKHDEKVKAQGGQMRELVRDIRDALGVVLIGVFIVPVTIYVTLSLIFPRRVPSPRF